MYAPPRTAPEKNAAREPRPKGRLPNKMPYVFVFCPRWPLPVTFDLDIRTRASFCTMHVTAKFHHPTFNRSEVILLTNRQNDRQTDKQTDVAETSTSLRYATPVTNCSILRSGEGKEKVYQIVYLYIMRLKNCRTRYHLIFLSWQTYMDRTYCHKYNLPDLNCSSYEYI